MSARRDRGRAARRALVVLPASCLALALLACERPSDAQPSAEPPATSAAKPAAATPPSAGEATSAAATTKSNTPVEKTSGSSDDEPAVAAEASSGDPGTASAAAGAARPSTATPAAAARRGEVAAADKAPAADKGGEASPGATARERKRGSAVSEEPFSAWLEGDVPLAAGQPATLRVVLQAKPPYHPNAEYPHKFTLGAAPDGMTYPTPVVKGMQVTPSEGVLSVPVVAGAAGNATVKGKLSFSVCTDERCLIEKRELALDVDVR